LYKHETMREQRQYLCLQVLTTLKSIFGSIVVFGRSHVFRKNRSLFLDHTLWRILCIKKKHRFICSVHDTTLLSALSHTHRHIYRQFADWSSGWKSIWKKKRVFNLEKKSTLATDADSASLRQKSPLYVCICILSIVFLRKQMCYLYEDMWLFFLVKKKKEIK